MYLKIVILFDNIHVNFGFDGNKGTFTVQKSGVYLFIFRGVVIFPQVTVKREFFIFYFKNENIGTNKLTDDAGKSVVVELDILVKANYEEAIMVGSYFMNQMPGFPPTPLHFLHIC